MTPKGYQVTSVKIPSNDIIMLCSKKTALFGVALLISQPSLSNLALNLVVLQLGLTSSPDLVSALKPRIGTRISCYI